MSADGGAGAAERPLRVACVGADAETAALVREALGVTLPAARVSVAEPTPLPDAECVVIVATPGLDEVLRDLRARGYRGAVVVLTADEGAPAEPPGSRFGVLATVRRGGVARELAAAVVTALDTLDEAGQPSAAWLELRRVEQLVAAGEIAMGLRHALNNPLTGLLAEAQMLEMDQLPAEQHEAVRRMVELCRRTIAVARRLDVIASPPGSAGGAKPSGGGGTA